jgi:hypothetical protein
VTETKAGGQRGANVCFRYSGMSARRSRISCEQLHQSLATLSVICKLPWLSRRGKQGRQPRAVNRKSRHLGRPTQVGCGRRGYDERPCVVSSAAGDLPMQAMCRCRGGASAGILRFAINPITRVMRPIGAFTSRGANRATPAQSQPRPETIDDHC